MGQNRRAEQAMICSFRAECVADVNALLERLPVNRYARFSAFPDVTFLDMQVEIECTSTHAFLRAVMGQIEDAHVMLDTLRMVPRAQNRLLLR